MLPVVPASAVRAAEEAWFADHPGGDLMGVAADAVARESAAVLRAAGDPPTGAAAAEEADPVVLVVAGPGNNAGDALFAAAALPGLVGRGLRLLVWPVSGATHAGGLAAAEASGATVVDAAAALAAVPGSALVLDGVSGLGGRPGLDADVAAVADAAHGAGIPVVAVDIPSGLAADGHEAPPSFRADVTVTFIAHKLAHVARPAAARCGRVVLVDLGVAVPDADVWLVEEADLAAWFPWPDASSDKYARGVVGIDTGSPSYPGAALLGVSGALHAGAGFVRFAGPSRDAVLAAFPSVVAPPDPAEPGRVQAWVCGSGWPGPDADRLARRLADGVPLVLDAGALAGLPPSLPGGCLLTPHAGELARLLGVERRQVEADPIGSARRAASATGASVLLKGATQYCAHPDGRVLIAEPGPYWTATAGSGDVLAGIAGALLAGGVPAWRAGALAASLQARAASLLPGPRTPEEVAASALPAAVVALEPRGPLTMPGRTPGQ